MAGKAGRLFQELKKDWMFIGRFVYDVLIYTLTKCGLPETSLPTTDCTENVYHRTDFVKIAGASVLRISLAMRDKWKQMFISKSKCRGFSNENILKFLEKLSRCCRLSRTNRTQALVELLLALCNEIIMYFHLHNIGFNLNNLIKLISAYIVGATGFNRNDLEKLEELFDSFDDISGYTEWITDFISRFATPYASRDDVSDLFIERVREEYEGDLKKLTDSLRFLPHDLFSDITDGRPENSAKSVSTANDNQSSETQSSEIGAARRVRFLDHLSTRNANIFEHFSRSRSNLCSKSEQRVAAKESEILAKIISIPSDSESLQPPKLPTGSEIGAMERKNSIRDSLLTCIENISELLEENKRIRLRSVSEVGIEQDLEKASLDAEEASHEIHGAKPKLKMT